MTTTEYNDAQIIWKMLYAGDSFRQASAAAQHILESKLENGSSLFTPLVTSVYVLYAKPFTRADAVGRLDDEIIPPEYRDLHRLLLKHRHQVYAHRDGDGFELDDFGPVNQVRAIRSPTEIRLLATNFQARFPAMPSIIDLCRALEEKTTYHVDKLWAKHFHAIPDKVGEYMLNVQDSSSDMWLPCKSMVLPD